MEPEDRKVAEERKPAAARGPDGLERRASVALIMFRRFIDWFFERHGVKTLTGSADEHIRNTERKASVLFGYLVLAVVAAGGGYYAKAYFDRRIILNFQSQQAKDTEQVKALRSQAEELKREKDKAEVKAQNAEYALAPWVELANSACVAQFVGGGSLDFR